ncbi:MAG TPA: hypothetical protein VNG51_26795 [Ktedonobacteraceae bacterium]|nr:hypothetical protein [Ktedonobacteraceae bacterium]
MQYFQTESSGSWREGYEQNREAEYAQQEMLYGGRVDLGEKVLPAQQRKKPVSHLLVRLLLALISTPVFFLAVAAILVRASQPVFPDLTNVDLLLALVSYVGVNVIGNLLLSRNLEKIDRSKRIIRRVIFAVVSCFLVPVLCWMMIAGVNGADGVLLVLVSAVVANGISYLTLCKKRSF